MEIQLKKAIDEYLEHCKLALANAIETASPQEKERASADLALAERMYDAPELFFAKQRELYACSSI